MQGFKIVFEFSDNSYFSNKELVKTYYMVSDDAADPVLQKATGTNIQWAAGKNPGVKVSTAHHSLSSSAIVPLSLLHCPLLTAAWCPSSVRDPSGLLTHCVFPTQSYSLHVASKARKVIGVL